MSMAAVAGKLRDAARRVTLTPECDNMASSLQTSSVIFLISSIVAISMYIVLFSYNYYIDKKSTRTDKEDHKKKVMNWATIAATVVSSISVLNSIWLYLSARGLNKCLQGSGSTLMQ